LPSNEPLSSIACIRAVGTALDDLIDAVGLKAA
jgi:hypothetical protein